MHALTTIFGTLLVCVAVWLAWLWRTNRSRVIIDRWAKENGYAVISANLRLWPGPFVLRRTEGQTVFRVHVRDATGLERHGWVRCGSLMLGLMSDQATVQWD